MLAILATSSNGERTRGWLQDRLWGSRGEAQASASLRRELSNLRKAFQRAGVEMIETEGGRIRLKIESLDIDVLRSGREGWARAERAAPDAEFLEGMDIRGEEGFEEWLAVMRRTLSNPRRENADVEAPRAAPAASDRHAATEAAPTVNASDATVLVLLGPLEDRIYDGRASNVARAFANEVVSQLARLRWLRVVSPDAIMAAGASVAGPRDDPDACFLVERALVGASGDESAEIRLLRSRSRELISTQRVSLKAEGTLDPIAAQLVARLATRIEREEQARVAHLPENDHDFRNLIWRGRWHVNRLTSRDSAIAMALFDQALALSPNSPEALIQKATALGWDKWAKRSPREQFHEISDLARRIMLLDPDDCRGYWLAGIAAVWLGNPAASVALLRRAIEIDASFEPAYTQLGATLNLDGRPEEALDVLNFALGLSPNDTHMFFRHNEIAFSWLLLRRWELCVGWVDRALLVRPSYWYAQTIKIHALVEMGDVVGASKMGEQFRRAHPNFNQEFLEWIPFSDRSWVKRLADSVQIATDGALGRVL